MTSRKTSRRSKLAGLFIMLFLFSGMFMAIYGFDKIENYYSPYTYSYIWIFLGLVSGYLLSKSIRPYLHFNKNQLKNYWFVTMCLIFSMCGLLLTVGSLINRTASKKEICDGFMVIDKQKIEYRYRQPGANLLFVNMHGVT